MKTAANNRKMRDSRHLMRYLKAKSGMDITAIAKSEKVSVGTIRESIESIERYEQQNTEGQLQLAVRDLVISTIPQAKETLNGFLTATSIVRKKNLKTGQEEDVRVEDNTTRLEGARLVRDLIVGLQPKGPGVVVNANQTNQTAVQVGKSETNEERLRRLKAMAAAHNQLPAQVAAVPVYIDEGEDSPDDEHEEDEDEEEGE